MELLFYDEEFYNSFEKLAARRPFTPVEVREDFPESELEYYLDSDQ